MAADQEDLLEGTPRCIADRCFNVATHRFPGHADVAICSAHLIGAMEVDTGAVRGTVDGRHIYSSACHICRDDTRHGLAESLLSEVDRLRRRDRAWGEATVWRSNWMTRAVTLLGDLRDVVQDEFPEHLAELDALLADEFEDGDDD